MQELKIFENAEGSPPRMRGKPTLERVADKAFGITPAHAGKTESLQALGHARWDHPRVCGENVIV